MPLGFSTPFIYSPYAYLFPLRYLNISHVCISTYPIDVNCNMFSLSKKKKVNLLFPSQAQVMLTCNAHTSD